MLLEKLNMHIQKKNNNNLDTDITLLLPQMNPKINHRPKCELQNYKSPRRHIDENLDDLEYGDAF